MVLDRLATELPARLTLDFDGSFCSTRRHAEGTSIGYNPKRKGARSYYLLLCTVAQPDQVPDVLHRTGRLPDSRAPRFHRDMRAGGGAAPAGCGDRIPARQHVIQRGNRFAAGTADGPVQDRGAIRAPGRTQAARRSAAAVVADRRHLVLLRDVVAPKSWVKPARILFCRQLSSRRVAGNRLYLLAGTMAHNLTREVQLCARPRQNTNGATRPMLWRFEMLSTVRNLLIRLADRLTRPAGHLVLTMNGNQAVIQDFGMIIEGISQAA